MACAANGAGQGFAGHAGDGGLARRIDVGQDENVCLIEGAAEFVPKMLRARVAMRLEEHEQAIELAAAGGAKRGANFRRMMAVIVNNGDVVHHSFDVEAAADAGKFCQAFANQVGSDVEVKGHGSCGGGVAYVVHSGRMREVEEAKIVAFVGEAEFALQTFELHVTDGQIGLAGGSVSDDGSLDAGDDGLDVGLVNAKNGGTIKWNAIDELNEGVLNIFE